MKILDEMYENPVLYALWLGTSGCFNDETKNLIATMYMIRCDHENADAQMEDNILDAISEILETPNICENCKEMLMKLSNPLKNV